MRSGIRASLTAAFFLTFIAVSAQTQENSAKRLSSIVGVAVEEYTKAVDDNGRLISKDEYDETTGFLQDARLVADRLKGYNAPQTQAILDTMITAVNARMKPAEFK